MKELKKRNNLGFEVQLYTDYGDASHVIAAESVEELAQVPQDAAGGITSARTRRPSGWTERSGARMITRQSQGHARAFNRRCLQ